jgi:phosphoketolase
MPEALSREELKLMDAYWRAANYLSVGQIYLYDNPLLQKPRRSRNTYRIFAREINLNLSPMIIAVV